MQNYTTCMIMVAHNSGTSDEAIGTFKQMTDSLLNFTCKLALYEGLEAG